MIYFMQLALFILCLLFIFVGLGVSGFFSLVPRTPMFASLEGGRSCGWGWSFLLCFLSFYLSVLFGAVFLIVCLELYVYHFYSP